MIHEFDPLVYPVRIWVGVKVPLDEVDGRFHALCEDDSLDRFRNQFERLGSRSDIASCYQVVEKESRYKGIFCHFTRPKDATVGTMAHEALHIACWICEQLGIGSDSFADSEPRAYLVGWITDCIYKVLKERK